MPAKTSRTVRLDMLTLLAATLFVLAGNGLLETSVSYRTSLLSQSSSLTGIIMACYYSGFLIGSWHAPALLNWLSHKRLFCLLIVCFATCIAVLGEVHQPYWVAALQFLCGLFISAVYVVVESYINTRSCNHTRGRYFSFYMTCWYLGVGCGQLPLLLNAGFHGYFFSYAALSVLCALIVCQLWRPRQSEAVVGCDDISPRPSRFIDLLRRFPRGYSVSLISGVMIGILFGMGPAFGEQFFSSSHKASMIVSSFVLGAIVVQMPLAKLSQRYGCEGMLAVMALLGISATLACSWLARSEAVDIASILLPLMLLGAACLPVYSLGAALIQNQVQDHSRVAASGLLLLCNGIGSVLGPLLCGLAMQQWGDYSFFGSLLLCHILLLCLSQPQRSFALLRLQKPV